MRTFIAIELSNEIKETLAQIESHLKYSNADVKWVESGNIHLTLKFLGEIDEKKSEEVRAVLDSIAKTTAPFELSIKNIGAFPEINYPRVIWVGLNKGVKESTELATKIDEALSKLGFAKESRPFTTHLTIGRVRSAKNKQTLKEKLITCDLQLKTFETITSVILFQSKLTPTGPIYTKLHESRFAN